MAARVLLACAIVFWVARGPKTLSAFADECTQPSTTGCPISPDTPTTAVLADANDVHTWQLTVTNAVQLHVVLSNLSGDYDVHVYAADGRLLGESTNEGIQDDVVDLPNVDGGTYAIYVNSPRGDAGADPYTLLVSASSIATALKPSAGAVPGTVVLTDNFTDPRNGWLPSGPVTNGMLRYLDGEYQIAKTTDANPWAAVTIPGTYSNSTIAFDMRFIDPLLNAGMAVGCRGSGPSQYWARIKPQARVVALVRNDAIPEQLTYLMPETPQPLLQRDSTTHVELRCIGSTIALWLNGSLAASAEDGLYKNGIHWISVGDTRGGPAEIRISHLVVTQL